MQSDDGTVNQVRTVNSMRTKDRVAAFVEDLRQLCLSCMTGHGAPRVTTMPYPYCDLCRKKWDAAAEIERLAREREALANTLAVEHERCLQAEKALQKIALLADTGSELHRKEFGCDSATGWTANGWRVAEKMREVANDMVGNLPLGETEGSRPDQCCATVAPPNDTSAARKKRRKPLIDR